MDATARTNENGETIMGKVKAPTVIEAEGETE